jgi:hypothetical protein
VHGRSTLRADLASSTRRGAAVCAARNPAGRGSGEHLPGDRRAGFIGSHLAQALLDRGDGVIGINSFTDYYRAQAGEPLAPP